MRASVKLPVICTVHVIAVATNKDDSNPTANSGSPPVSLDDHSESITNVMELSNLNKRPYFIDLIQTPDYVTLITVG